MKKTKQKLDSQRLAVYRKIEWGLKQLPHMNEETYREILRNNFKDKSGNPISSKSQLSSSQLNSLVDILAKDGVVFTNKNRTKVAASCPNSDWIEIPKSLPYANEKRQICAIWKKLGYLMARLNTRVEREFKVDSFMHLDDGKSISKLLTDLQKREKAHDKKVNKL